MAENKNINYSPNEDGVVEGLGPVLSVLADRYCDNLINPEEEKRIEPKKLYITLGAAFAGAVLLFLFVGWLLCYCPLKTTGVTVDDFIREFNAISSDSDINDAIESTIEMMNSELGGTISASDIVVAYPDFSDLTIPEDANLEKGIYLCDDNILLKADVVGGKIQKMTVGISDKCHTYDATKYRFGGVAEADIDYSTFPYYAAPGKARLAFYRYVYNEEVSLPDEFTIYDALNFCMGMINGAYYSFADASDYSPDQSYFEYCDNTMFYFIPNNFELTIDTRDKVLCGKDNGLYRFYDSIFGEKEEKTPTDDSSAGDPVSSASVVSGS